MQKFHVTMVPFYMRDLHILGFQDLRASKNRFPVNPEERVRKYGRIQSKSRESSVLPPKQEVRIINIKLPS